MSTVAEDAQRLLEGERWDTYGDPVRTCERIGQMWGLVLGVPDISPETVALMMVALKIVRETRNEKRDNLVDAVGYLLIAERACASS